MRKRNREILLCLSDKDFEKLEQVRNAASMTRQEYLLDLVQKLSLIRCPKPDTAKYQDLFNKDGKRINEMAHHFNATGQIDIADYVSCMNTLHCHMSQLEEEITKERRCIDHEEGDEDNT